METTLRATRMSPGLFRRPLPAFQALRARPGGLSATATKRGWSVPAVGASAEKPPAALPASLQPARLRRSLETGLEAIVRGARRRPAPEHQPQPSGPAEDLLPKLLLLAAVMLWARCGRWCTCGCQSMCGIVWPAGACRVLARATRQAFQASHCMTAIHAHSHPTFSFAPAPAATQPACACCTRRTRPPTRRW